MLLPSSGLVSEYEFARRHNPEEKRRRRNLSVYAYSTEFLFAREFAACTGTNFGCGEGIVKCLLLPYVC
jgi:hypothetical protein